MVLNGLISAFCRWPGSFVIKDWTSNERLGEILASEASINVYMVISYSSVLSCIGGLTLQQIDGSGAAVRNLKRGEKGC